MSLLSEKTAALAIHLSSPDDRTTAHEAADAISQAQDGLPDRKYPSLLDAVTGLVQFAYEKGMHGQAVTSQEVSDWTVELEKYPRDWHPQQIIDAAGDISD